MKRKYQDEDVESKDVIAAFALAERLVAIHGSMCGLCMHAESDVSVGPCADCFVISEM